MFFADPLKRVAIRFLIHEAAGVAIALRPGLIARVVDLGAILDRAVSVAIAIGWIGCQFSLLEQIGNMMSRFPSLNKQLL